ncbi:MAG: hypothetical protein Hyperionvirus37_2 [Hyperionvirus sp.]|uniref:Uncharacterized protein n=1 Tax=Hyperionvirus sp. TaxID=2487770 RepID=A0A3G5AH70_9VIRU|nr:MAG: hypothetical protein Hyperionvirus37_2 [Hyperionvirus sp.]
MNRVFRNKIMYRYESFWRESEDDPKRDSNGKRFPFPQIGNKYWTDKEQFKTKLIGVQNYLKTVKKFKKYPEQDHKNCLLCDAKNITTGSFNLNNIIWEDGLIHYIDTHNVRPTNDFIEAIYKFNPIIKGNKNNQRTIKYGSVIYKIDDMKYLKLERNQILIMDALMKHGGYTKKYVDKKNRDVYRFSEHAGLLDFNTSGLDKLIISGKTTRVDKGDEDIYLPQNMPDAMEYEYIFHTHPPTPKPGGRAKLIGILYEFPSISDLFHFIDHYNLGTTQGSLVITAEGMYNIRKLVFDGKKIKINEDKMYSEMQDVMRDAQRKAIDKYGTDFTPYDFYSKVTQDREFINMLNGVLNKYKLQIDYYSREKDDKGKWIIDTVHLPIYVMERK